MSISENTTVKVAIRVRPLLEREKIKRCKECLYVLPNKNQLVVGKDQNFTFDYVFNEATSQQLVYEDTVKPLVQACLDGYNATVFAYGQTGSGKTFTIEGEERESELQGIIPRAAAEFFMHIQGSRNEKEKIVVKVSYLEIYLEEVKDLLNNSSDGIHIREDEKGNTVVQGLKEVTVQSAEELQKLMRFGMAVRTTHATQMNEHSSRSHAILTIHIHKQSPTSVRNVEVTSAKFHFVDLAGSERAHRTGNIGDRFKESVHINSGLLALGNVISALTDSKRKSGHVPYRASKITRLLKDSLGGNSRTLMVTCVSPASDSFEETLNSLKYAKRARSICNRPIINKDVVELEMQRMESEILQLREQLKTRENSSSETSGDMESLQEIRSWLQSEVESYKQLLENCQRDLEYCISKKSLSGLPKILETLKSRGLDGGHSSSDVSDGVFDEDNIKANDVVSTPRGARAEVTSLKRELEQCKADLLNDEKIFADQQLDFEQIKLDLNSKLESCEEEIYRLRAELVEVRGTAAEEPLNTTLKKGSVKITRTKSCTLQEIEEIVRKKTFVILQKNIKNCLATPTTPKSPMLGTFTVNKNCTLKEHSTLESMLEEAQKKNAALTAELKQVKEASLGVHESKKTLEKNVTMVRKQKSDLEKRLNDAEKDLTKLQSKAKKEKLVSLGREKLAKKTSESSCNTSQSHVMFNNQSADRDLEAELHKVLEERQRLRVQEEELKLREAAIKEREDIEREISKLKNKEVRASQVISKDLLRMSMKLEKLDSEIANKSLVLSSTKTLSKSVNIENEMRDLKRRREEIKSKADKLNCKINSGELLSGEEQTRYTELCEALEIADAAISYRSNVIETEDDTTDKIASQLPPTKDITNALFAKLIAAREESNSASEEVKLLKLELERREVEMKTLNETLISTSLDGGKGAESAQLRRDVEYYKQLVKDLKGKLRNTRDNGGAASALGGQVDGPSTPSAAGGFGGVLTPVRKSKKELRPITAEEAFHRSAINTSLS